MGRNNRDQIRLSQKNGIEYKECTKCGEAFPHTNEYFFGDGKPRVNGIAGLRGDCKKCKQSYQTKARKDKSAQWKEFKLQLSCQDCGFPTEEDKERFGDLWTHAIEFNHRDPTTKE